MSDAHITVRQLWDDRIEIGARESLVYRFGPRLPKPCIHPLVTARGHLLSGFEMSDHLWHRGLWFAIKFVNGTNFWEEHAPFGVQVSQGQPRCEVVAADTVRVSHDIHWTSDATGVAIREQRVLTFRGRDTIDWTSNLTAVTDLELDRTPYTTWGGYGGLAFRAARALHDVTFLLPGGDTAGGLAGQRHEWCVMQARVDGGRDQQVSLAMLDHPANPRSPSPWYCKSGNGFNYMNPAFLFHEPMLLNAGEALCFRYRVRYRDGLWSAGDVASLASLFRDSRGEER